MAQRQYESATVFAARIVDMRHLWEPSREFQGKPTTKPNYFASFIVPKTQAAWHTEPTLAGLTAACGKIYATSPHVTTWPVTDGDIPMVDGKHSEWAKRHWIFSASSSNPPNTEIVQAGGVLLKLSNRVGVKPGDNVMAGVTAAVTTNDVRRVKLYLNAVVFSGPGEEIVFANSVSGAELMRMAAQQGLRVAGFTGAPHGGGQPFGAPGGFPGQAPAFHQGQPGAGPSPGAAPGSGPNGGTPGYASPGAPAPFGAPSGQHGDATFPSNPPQGPFGAPGAFPQR